MKRHFNTITVLFCIGVLSTTFMSSCKEAHSKKESKPVVINFKKEGELQLIKASNDSIVQTLDIEIADDNYQIQTGLMYRDAMKTNEGMLFIFPDENYRNFYMKNTRIPLDIIYVDSNKTIVSIQKNAKPFDETSLPSEAPAKYVLEINGGLADEWQLQKGDLISFSILN